MWRPDNWGEVNPKPIGKSMTFAFDREDMYEHGEACVDAMLGALKKQGVHIDESQNPLNTTVGGLVDFFDICKGGWLIFIEEIKDAHKT